LKFGLTFVPVLPLSHPQDEGLREILEQAQCAKKSGFDSLWAAQHHVTDTEQMFQPLPLLARFSGDFPGMMLGTSSLLLSLLNPVDVAEQVANIDILCGGKFILGVSLGYREKEFQAFNVLKKDRVGRFVEGVEIIRRLWTQDNVSFRGRHFNLQDVSINPKPLQLKGPQIWVGADTERGAERAGEIGDAWMISPRQSIGHVRKLLARYMEATRKRGRGDGKLLLMRELHVAKRKADALRNAEPYLKQMYNTYLKWGQPGERYDLSFEELAKGRYIVGDPATCIEELSNLEKELHPEQISFRMTWPGMKHTDVVESIKLFGEKVIPHFRKTS
jgi:alkanesulfonate monooxygenase SsuD/methylene tetrahydromethanopterin reductase-like flavin-dependent oxidoreductase (luciferase family)